MTVTGGRAKALRWSTAMMLVAASGAILSLGGCDRLSAPAAEQQDGGLDAGLAMKLSAYYRITTDFDPVTQKQEYAELNAGKAKSGDTLFIDHGRLDVALSDLARTRAMDGALEGIDPAADRVLQTLGRLTARARSLDSYFTMRGYLTDDYARAHREDPAMLADYDAAIAAYAPFVGAVEQATARQETFLLRRMQAEGRMNDYHDIRIVRQTRAIRAATATPATFGTPDAAVRADQLVATLAPMLDQGRAAWAAAQAKLPAGESLPRDSSVIPMAEQMIGAYRQFRRSGDADDYERFRSTSASVLQAGG